MHPRPNVLIEELVSDQGWLVALTRSLLRDAGQGPEGADDLAQEAARVALTNTGRDSFATRGQARAWLATTVKNLAWNANRRRKSEAEARERLQRDGGARTSQLANPEEVLSKAEFRARVASLILDLPEDDRSALLLRFYEGRTTREIQEALQAPSPEAVRKRISRGVQALRNRLDSGEDAGRWHHAAILTVGTSGATKLPAAAAGLTALVAVAAIGAALVLVRDARPSPLQVGSDGPGQLTALGASKAASITAPDASSAGSAGRGKTEPAEDVSAGRRAIDLRVAEVEKPGAVIRVRLVDEVSGEPLRRYPWFLIRTGDHDVGGRGSLSGKNPNPDPIALGVTDDDGFLSTPVPEDELVNLCTDRSDTHARGSWPIRIEDGGVRPGEVHLSSGTTIRGRVVDERGDPIENIEVYSKAFGGAIIPLAETDSDGRYEFARAADFPRGFVLGEGETASATRVLPTTVFFARSGGAQADEHGFHGAAQLDLRSNGSSELMARDVVISRQVLVSGRVVDSLGQPLEGAVVSVESSLSSFAYRGYVLNDAIPPLPWLLPGAELPTESCLTGTDGRFEISADIRGGGSRDPRVVAFSPGGGIGIREVAGLAAGGRASDITVTVDDSTTVILRLKVAPGEGDVEDPSSGGRRTVELIWDLPRESGPWDPPSGRTPTWASTPALERSEEGMLVRIARVHQPDRSVLGGEGAGRLSGTILVEGFEVARFALAPGDQETDVELRPLRRIPTQLRVIGDGAEHLRMATVSLTPEPPDPKVTVDRQVNRMTTASLLRTVEYSWKHGETRSPYVHGDRGVYAYVELHPVGRRDAISLPPFGPLDPDEFTADAPFLIEHELETWPERSVVRAPGASPDVPAALAAKRSSTIKARVVSAADGRFLPGAKVVALEAPARFRYQRLWKGEEREIDFALPLEQVTLRFEAAGHLPLELGPLNPPADGQLDLGVVEMEALRRIPCRLVRAGGAPVDHSYVVERRDPEAGWERTKTETDGRFDLYVGSQGPTPLTVRYRDGSSDPACTSSVEMLPDGSALVEIPEWRPVTVRMTGLAFPYSHGSWKIALRKASASADPTRRPMTRRWSRIDGTDLLFDMTLPPGSWEVQSAVPAHITFSPVSIDVPGVGEGERIEVTVRAALAF
ncbi:MAG: sigma-70 family RNA polymerase sigma factor [Planctomycetota bacterium]